MKIFTIGYSGRKPHELKEIIEKVNGIIVDCRFSPKSRAPQWNRGPLEKSLGHNFYTHFKDFGNVNYKGGPIEIVNYNHGLELLELIHKTTKRTPILMCVCADFKTCHRTTLADMLRADGHDVEEYTDSDELSFDEDAPKSSKTASAVVKKILPTQLIFSF